MTVTRDERIINILEDTRTSSLTTILITDRLLKPQNRALKRGALEGSRKRKNYWEKRLRVKDLETNATVMWLPVKGASLKSLPPPLLGSGLSESASATKTKTKHGITFRQYFDERSWTAFQLSCKQLYRHTQPGEFQAITADQTRPLHNFVKTVQNEMKNKWFFQGLNWSSCEILLLAGGVLSLVPIGYCAPLIVPASRAWFAQRAVLGSISTRCTYGNWGDKIASCADFYVDTNYGRCWPRDASQAPYPKAAYECAHGIVSICFDPCNVLNQLSLEWGGLFSGLFFPAIVLSIASIYFLCKFTFKSDDCFDTLSNESIEAFKKLKTQDYSTFLSLPRDYSTPVKPFLQQAQTLLLKAPVYQYDVPVRGNRYRQFNEEQRQRLLDAKEDEDLNEKVKPWYKRVFCCSRRK